MFSRISSRLVCREVLLRSHLSTVQSVKTVPKRKRRLLSPPPPPYRIMQQQLPKTNLHRNLNASTLTAEHSWKSSPAARTNVSAISRSCLCRHAPPTPPPPPAPRPPLSPVNTSPAFLSAAVPWNSMRTDKDRARTAASRCEARLSRPDTWRYWSSPDGRPMSRFV